MELTPAEQERWLRVIGSRAAPFADRTLKDIELDAWGNCVIDAPFHCAVYLVVDADDTVVYVGKVDRTDGTLADRFRQHHAWNDYWDRAWVVPIDSCVSAQQVFELELSLIRHFDPVDNR